MLRTYFQNIFVKIIFTTLKISHNFEFKAVVRLTFTLVEKNVNTNNKAIAKNNSQYHFYNYLSVFFLFFMAQLL